MSDRKQIINTNQIIITHEFNQELDDATKSQDYILRSLMS